jgi:hypothetical protein
MIPADYKDFLMAIVTASASFIGLLFVAMTFIMDKSGKSQKQLVRENMLSEGSYIALVDLFFVALVGLIPNTEVGHVTAIMGLIGINSSYRQVRAGLKSGVSWGTFAMSTAIYLSQIAYGVYIILHENKPINETIFLTTVIVLFASALGRAWELTGINEAKHQS